MNNKNKKINIIVETPKDSRNKYAYDPKEKAFKLKKVLPEGMSFPYNCGYIPGTKAADGDPLDILILMDEPAFPGCIVEIRLIGIIEAKEKEKGEKSVSNPRIIGVAEESQLYKKISSLKELDKDLIKEIDNFFISYNKVRGKIFKPTGHFGPKRALKFLNKSGKSIKETQNEEESKMKKGKIEEDKTENKK